jgi:hypothetical protein
MANKNSNKEAEKATLNEIKEEMAKPRIAKSARIVEPEMLPIFDPKRKQVARIGTSNS